MLHGNARKSRGWGGAFELDLEDEYRHWRASGGGGFGQYWKVLDAQGTRRCHFYLPEAPAFINPLQSGICLQWGRPRFNLWSRKIPWRREWQPTAVFLPGESHGQRSLPGNPWDHKASDMTEMTDTWYFWIKRSGKYSKWKVSLEITKLIMKQLLNNSYFESSKT